jgi:2-oxoglutarate dehydrogenase E2 component (dihydrolipoamide succinyltransferase)
MIAIKVPPLGESIVEATISRWLKKEGEAVASGETIVELETDKITVEVPALKAGVLVSRAKAEGDVVAVDETLGQLDESAAVGAGAGAGAGTGAASAAGAGAPPQQQGAAAGAGAQDRPAASAAAPSRGVGAADVKASPAARRVAAEQNVDLAGVAGTGRGGVVSKPDVVEHVRQAPTAPQPTQPATPATPARPAAGGSASPAHAASGNGARETREKMTTRRRRIAENLLQSQLNTAHLTTFNEIDMTAVSALRERLKERVEKEHGVRLSFMPFFVKAASLALKAFPTVNARIDGDTVVYHHYVNMGIAVASDQGLVVPNVKDADRKGMIQVSRDIVEVAKRARDGKLTMDDLTGGTFTITNGGVFGSLISTPIINYPQVGILGLHKTQDRPVAIDGKVEIRPMMYVALSYDHRIIDGQQAVLFLVKVKELMEDPGLMLVD